MQFRFYLYKKERSIYRIHPITKKLSFCTHNDGYIFCDIEDNQNSVNIELEISQCEHDIFSNNIISELIETKKNL